MKVYTDEKIIDKFLTRGVDTIFPSKEALKEKLMSGERIRVYQGFDPTGPYLHVGHAMGIRAMRLLQQLGHEVIFLIGDYTAKLGDPDKDSTRKILTDEEIQKNLAGWKEQVKNLIDFSGENPVQVKYNSAWLSKLTLADLLELMSHVTVQQLIERDLFQRRLSQNNPIGLHEFLYPLMQGFDGVAMEVDMEMGGSDQIFNMNVGRKLTKAYLSKEKYIRANKLMPAPGGLTMSKTKGNGINLSDTPEDIYGKTMAYRDDQITLGLELLTDIPMEQIAEIEQEIEAGTNPMQFKKLLAFEVVRILKGEEEAKKAQEVFEQTVQQRDIPQNISEKTLKAELPLAQALREATGMSATQIRRLASQGGLSVNEVKLKDVEQNTRDAVKPGDVIRLGKRTYLKVKELEA